MCRLFGLHAGHVVARATFWLLDAPDSLAAQSRRNPDGTGIGVFDSNWRAVLHKQPIAAWEDTDFACEAKHLSGTTFVAHVRYASTGKLDVLNTHPFVQDGRLFAHNGVVGGLEVLDARLAELSVADLVLGQTDSERVFALVTAAVRSRGGDVAAGLTDALRWLADNVPIYAVNLLLCTATEMWALRYPEPNNLYVLQRRDLFSSRHFDMQTPRIHAQSDHLDQHPSVVFASEPMDDDSGWQLIDPGVLVHVDDRLTVTQREILPDPPAHQLTLADLNSTASASQHSA
ncbi:MAG: hypothetical protein QOH57_3081 [Mycobacterium sp.]|jgi:glutamine amidotransferase|nr:hypothetical protein [Mycobacterium sp.]